MLGGVLARDCAVLLQVCQQGPLAGAAQGEPGLQGAQGLAGRIRHSGLLDGTWPPQTVLLLLPPQLLLLLPSTPTKPLHFHCNVPTSVALRASERSSKQQIAW